MAPGYGKILTLPLPSGNKVRVRRTSLLTLVRLNQIPPQLISAVWTVFGKDDGTPVVAKDELDRVQTMVALMDQAIKAVLVDVKIVDGDVLSDTDEDADGFMIGTANLRDIPDADKALIFGFAQGVVNADPIKTEVRKDLEKFPAGAAGETPGPGSETVRPAAEQSDSAPAEQPASVGV